MITLCPNCEEDGLFISLANIDGVHVRCAKCGLGFYLVPETMLESPGDAFSMSFESPFDYPMVP
jgi:hypothetical protein